MNFIFTAKNTTNAKVQAPKATPIMKSTCEKSILLVPILPLPLLCNMASAQFFYRPALGAFLSLVPERRPHLTVKLIPERLGPDDCHFFLLFYP
jgi:hypothetical protein